MPPRKRPAAGAARRGGQPKSRTAKQPHGPSLRSAHTARAQAPRAAQTGPSAAMARMDVRLRVPFRMRRGAQRPADQGSRLFERRRREFERDPASTEHHRLPRRCAAQSACAHRGRAQQRPVWLLGCWAAHPLLAAPAAGRLRGGMRVGARMLRYLTRRVCPNAAAQQRSELCGAPRKRPAAGLPRRGRRLQGRLSFGYFSLAKQRTSTSPAGARPGPPPLRAQQTL